MCVQCMIGAAATVGSASGIRAWLGVKRFQWLTPRRTRYVTAILFSAAVLLSSAFLGGSR
jgi:hypothetical protein